MLTQLAHHGETRLVSESISLGSQISLKAARDQPINAIKCFWMMNYTQVDTAYANQHAVWTSLGVEILWGNNHCSRGERVSEKV